MENREERNTTDRSKSPEQTETEWMSWPKRYRQSVTNGSEREPRERDRQKERGRVCTFSSKLAQKAQIKAAERPKEPHEDPPRLTPLQKRFGQIKIYTEQNNDLKLNI